MNHFSKYAITKKHTLNIKGGADSNYFVCAACGGGYVRCKHACIHTTCSPEVYGFVCGK